MTFYFFILSFFIILSSLLVVISNNSITSVLYLICVYVLSSLCFLLLGAEFLAILIIIVYIGAISILFLFVIMMLNLRIVEVYNSLINYFSIGSFLGFWFFTLFFFSVKNDIKFIFVNFIYNNALELNIIANDLLLSYSNLFLLGDLLYNSFSYLLIFAALVLFVSMLGSIVLTIEFDYHTTKYKKIDNYTIQDIRNRIIILGISN